MSTPEFSRPLDVRQAEGKAMKLETSEAERRALAQRFSLVSVDRLEADLMLDRTGRVVDVQGTLIADIVQSCAVSAEDVPVAVREKVTFRFVPEGSHTTPSEEVELEADDCDEIEYAGSHFDVGEAVAQSLALAIDPFLTGPNADEVRRKVGLMDESASGPFAALAKLKKD